MSKFDSVEISTIVSLHPKVVKHKILGIFEYVYYQPTHSFIHSFRNYYDAREAAFLISLTNAKEPCKLLDGAADLQTSDRGEYRVDLCMSKDRNFVAFQVYRCQESLVETSSKLCILEGNDARILESLLV